MSAIVWGACTAHTAAMLRVPPVGDDAVRAQRVFDGFASLNRSLLEARPDVLVVIATDHFQSFSYDAVPIFAIGHGARFETWGEFGSPHASYGGIEELCESVLGSMIGAEFDVVSAAEMRLDHSFSCPLGFVLKDATIPILPIFVNCNVPPLPTLARSSAFGRKLGRVLRAQAIAPRVAILGTGGLSHWVGMPETGIINERFDRRFLELFESGEIDALTQWDAGRIVAEAGNGAAEVRNWLLVASALDGARAHRLAYEPVGAWKTGIALVQMACI
jgi:aromatic ring-opening dioxygenase catalytic subunit (LigB family)